MKLPADLDPTALVAAMGDAVMVCDAAGLITVWNAAATRLFGYTEDEALGQRLDLIIPERLRKRHWEGYDHSMATGTTKYGTDVLRVPAVDKAGRAMSIAFTVFMMHGPDGKVSAVGSVIRDETERFAQDRALKARVAELQAQLAQATAGRTSDGTAGSGSEN